MRYFQHPLPANEDMIAEVSVGDKVMVMLEAEVEAVQSVDNKNNSERNISVKISQIDLECEKDMDRHESFKKGYMKRKGSYA